MRLWMICYDIADDRRRRQIATWLADQGASRTQESVFEGWFDHRGIERAIEGLAMRIEAAEDSVRAYPLHPAAPGRRNGCGVPPPRLPSHWAV
jgi:CRISPR-associated protein Cas2